MAVDSPLTAPISNSPEVPGTSELLALLAQTGHWHVISDRHGSLLWASQRLLEAAGEATFGLGTRLPLLLRADGSPGTDDHSLQRAIGSALLRGDDVDQPVTLDLPPGLQRVAVRVRIQSFGDQRLWTMTDLRVERALGQRLQRVEELLETVQEFGRLGVWERDITSGTGHWDRHVFRFLGLDPAAQAPSFTDATRNIHPEDIRLEEFTQSTRQIGNYAQRFRVLRPDGGLRWLHSQWKIKPGQDGQPSRAIGVMVDDTDAVATAHSLDEATAKLAFAVELGEIVIFEHDLITRRVHLNARGLEMLGLQHDPQGIPVERMRQLIHPDDLQQDDAAYKTALARPGPVDMQIRYRSPDGRWQHILSRRVLQRDALDRPMKMVGVAMDVSERVEEEFASAELARRLEVATAAAGVGIWSRDLLTGQAHWSEQMFKLCGWPLLRGTPSEAELIMHAVHPDDRKAVRAAIAELHGAASGAAEYEYRVCMPDGSVRWLVDRVRREAWNGGAMMFGATIDITERRAADQALAQARERIALATQGAGIATWELDLSGEMARWDPQMYVLRGMPVPVDCETTAYRQPWTAGVHPEDLPRVLAAHQRSLADGSMAAYEFRVIQPDGSTRWLAARSMPAFEANGIANRVLGVNWDVNERVIAEEVRREAQAAQRRSDAKSALLARMSHELRTPLNAILGFTQLLAGSADAAVDESIRNPAVGDRTQMLAHIRRAAEQLLELVDEVLDLSTGKPSAPSLKMQPVALEPVLQAAIASIGSRAQARAARVRVVSADGAIRVLANAPRLRQILTKLLDRQLSQADQAHSIEVSISAAGGEACIRTRCPGEQQAIVRQARLFDSEFDQSQVTSLPSEADLGMFDALLSAMNGRIEVVSGDAGEIRLQIYLPLAELPPANETADAPPSAKILYIEDNPVNVILVRELVAQRGRIEFHSEATGLAGVDRAAVFLPDLILIDIHLPDIDGFEVLRRLREHPPTRATCCVALSANAIPEDIERAKAAGFDDYWTKPIRFGPFLAGLDRLLLRSAQG